MLTLKKKKKKIFSYWNINVNSFKLVNDFNESKLFISEILFFLIKIKKLSYINTANQYEEILS